jgi:glycosyltransferase involved in cell wall biosynthesis
MELSIVMPALNEEKNIQKIVSKVYKSFEGKDIELIIVNDNSTDNTQELAMSLKKKYRNITVLKNEIQSGKTMTVKRGLLLTKGEYVVIQDSDLEYDPEDLKEIYKQIVDGDYDVVYGNRFTKGNKVIYLQNWIGNTFLSFVSSIFTGIRNGMWTRDMEVCYKMARGKVFREIAKTIKSKSTFGLEPELTAKFSRIKGLKFTQVPISYTPRKIVDGKKMNAISDGTKALFEILYYNIVK